MRAEIQLKVVLNIAGELNEEHRKIQYETIEMLAMKLKTASESIESTIRSDRTDQTLDVRRWKYALTHQSIARAIEDLKMWQELFDPNWYLMTKMKHIRIDTELGIRNGFVEVDDLQDPILSARSLREALNPSSGNTPLMSISESVLGTLTIKDIPLCSAQLGSKLETGTTDSFILERIQPLPGVEISDLKKDARDLTRRLYHSNASQFGLLRCKGYVHHRNQSRHAMSMQSNSFTMIFRFPAGFSQPRTLRHCFQEMEHPNSLSDRFRLANEIARAVSYVHTFGFVHKNIRPETILLLQNDDSSIGSAFLIGFDSFRMASGQTVRQGEVAWERCLYQHPQRIGISPSRKYIMQHDIYSLGVCLLEIGLWESFVSYKDSSVAIPSSGTTLDPERGSILGPETRTLFFKENLLSLARGELRKRMGTKYSEVVVTCLTCLDPGNLDFGDEEEFQDEDGIEVGVRYIEKVRYRNRILLLLLLTLS